MYFYKFKLEVAIIKVKNAVAVVKSAVKVTKEMLVWILFAVALIVCFLLVAFYFTSILILICSYNYIYFA